MNFMGSNRTYTVTYTLEMVQDAVRTYVWRKGVLGQKPFWLMALLLIGLTGWMAWRGERGLLLSVAIAAACMPLILTAMAWLAQYRGTVGRFRRMQKPEAQISFQEDGLAVASGLGGGVGAGVLKWAEITEVWERPGYLMVFSGPARFSIIPAHNLAAEDIARLRAAGGA